MKKRQSRANLLRNCRCCGERTVIVNKYKELCAECSKATTTHSWKLGFNKAECRKKLTQFVAAGKSLTDIAAACNVHEKTIMNWFRVYLDTTYRVLRRSIVEQISKQIKSGTEILICDDGIIRRAVKDKNTRRRDVNDCYRSRKTKSFSLSS